MCIAFIQRTHASFDNCSYVPTLAKKNKKKQKKSSLGLSFTFLPYFFSLLQYKTFTLHSMTFMAYVCMNIESPIL